MKRTLLRNRLRKQNIKSSSSISQSSVARSLVGSVRCASSSSQQIITFFPDIRVHQIRDPTRKSPSPKPRERQRRRRDFPQPKQHSTHIYHYMNWLLRLQYYTLLFSTTIRSSWGFPKMSGRQLHSHSSSGSNTLLHDSSTTVVVPSRLDSSWIQSCILPLSKDHHKGSCGRIGIVGGNEMYTGAPYYAAMASLYTGSDLVTIFCASEAAIPLKSYSPECMILPVYSAERIDPNQDSNYDVTQSMLDGIKPLLPQLHALVLGPGMGRNPRVMQAAAELIRLIQREYPRLALILDADALYMLSLPEYHDLFSATTTSRRHSVIVTPNQMEYRRLVEEKRTTNENGTAISTKADLSNVIIIKKGHFDQIIHHESVMAYECREEGGLKRSGGIGDILAGTVATMAASFEILREGSCRSSSDDSSDHPTMNENDDLLRSCAIASLVVKRATRRAFEKHRRSMTAPHVLEELGPTFNEVVSTESDAPE